jgi:hypothetical protein
MPLFRKKSRGQAERLAAWRSESLQRGGVADEGLGALLEELGARFSEHRKGRAVEVGGGRLFVGTIDNGTTLSGWAPFAATQDRADLAGLLERNLDPVLVWTSRSNVGDDDELGARFAVPLDGFERGAVLLALETMAASLGDEALAGRAREAREPPRGEAAEQQANARAAEAIRVALDAVGLPADDAAERPGIWHVTTDRGVVEAILRDTGESLLLMHELEHLGDEADVEVLLWLLGACDWGSARLGLTSLPGGPGLFSTCAVPAHALEPQALAWGVGQVLLLADEYDRMTKGQR